MFGDEHGGKVKRADEMTLRVGARDDNSMNVGAVTEVVEHAGKQRV